MARVSVSWCCPRTRDCKSGMRGKWGVDFQRAAIQPVPRWMSGSAGVPDLDLSHLELSEGARRPVMMG